MPEIPRVTPSGQVRTGGRPFGSWEEGEEEGRGGAGKSDGRMRGRRRGSRGRGQDAPGVGGRSGKVVKGI